MPGRLHENISPLLFSLPRGEGVARSVGTLESFSCLIDTPRICEYDKKVASHWSRPFAPQEAPMASLSRPHSLAYKFFWWVPFGRVPEVEPVELMRRLGQPGSRPQLLDVRTGREWRNGHIPGAVNIPITMLRSEIHALKFDRHMPVVTICLTAHRSIPALRVLLANGFSDVSQLAGGMMAWRREGLPVERGKP
jgi:rhodanese-related sulfurtransferase